MAVPQRVLYSVMFNYFTLSSVINSSSHLKEIEVNVPIFLYGHYDMVFHEHERLSTGYFIINNNNYV